MVFSSDPTSPTELQAEAQENGELLVTWKPPKVPNGNVTHYYVYWQLQTLNTETFDQRDYCKHREWPQIIVEFGFVCRFVVSSVLSMETIC